MHATIEQLIAFRDGQPCDGPMHAHIGQCSVCINALTGLKQRQQDLKDLPQLAPSPDVYGLLRQRVQAPRDVQRGRLRAWTTAAAWVLGMLGLVVIWSGSNERDDTTVVSVENLSPTPPGHQPLQDDQLVQARLDALNAESQRLEATLRQLAEIESGLVPSSTQKAISALENRLAILDYALSLNDVDQYAPQQAEQLMLSRVSTLQNMLGVQQAELARNGYHGFQVLPTTELQQDQTW